MQAGDTRRGRVYVALAAIAWSTAGLFQRELTVGLATQLAGRALFAMLGIGVFIAATERGRSLSAFRAIGRPGLAIAALMAVSSGSFIAALNYTSVANVLFLQGLAPVLAAVLGSSSPPPPPQLCSATPIQTKEAKALARRPTSIPAFLPEAIEYAIARFRDAEVWRAGSCRVPDW